jgi:hypothetical protein
MDTLKTFLEQQSLLSMFLVIGLGYAIGSVNIRGFAPVIGGRIGHRNLWMKTPPRGNELDGILPGGQTKL